jgi:hypothetical protein
MAALDNGYEISIDWEHNILKLRLWGLWNKDVAAQFESEIKAKIVELSRYAKKSGWVTFADLSKFPPQLGSVQNMTKAIMAFEVAHGMKKAATLVDRTMTKFQVQRLAKESGFEPGSFFQSESDALAWLLTA